MGLAIAWTQAGAPKRSPQRSGVPMGTQQHAGRCTSYTIRQCTKAAIGELKEVRTWVPNSEWSGSGSGDPEIAPVPDYLDWNMWPGGRPPYTPYWEGKAEGLVRQSDCSHLNHLQTGACTTCDIWPVGPGGRGRTHDARLSGTALFPEEGVNDNCDRDGT